MPPTHPRARPTHRQQIACHVSLPPFIVCEDASLGNLSTYLGLAKPSQRPMWRLLHQAAIGLEGLHKNHVVHGDLKLNNMLVGADGKTRIADFGMSFVRSSSVLSAGGPHVGSYGGLPWRAPECLDRRPSFASDVYSLAMCFIEAVTGMRPYPFQDDQKIYCLVRDGRIPPEPESMSDTEWQLVRSMTAFEPSQRISLTEAIATLKSFAEKETTANERVKSDDPNGIRGNEGIREAKPVGEDSGSDSEDEESAGDADGSVATAESCTYLIDLLESGSDPEKEQAAGALWSLTASEVNQATIAEAGAIRPLVSLLSSGTDMQTANAAGALSNLARSVLNAQ